MVICIGILGSKEERMKPTKSSEKRSDQDQPITSTSQGENDVEAVAREDWKDRMRRDDRDEDDRIRASIRET